MMERVLIFQDVANIEAGYRGLARQSRIPARPLDQGHLLGYLSEGRFLIDAFAYLPVDPRLPIDREILGERFWSGGWHVNEKIGKISNGGFKCNMDVEMALDIMELCLDIRPDSVIICSGDEDFLPLVYRLRRLGIRVEVASFADCAARALRRQASGYVELDVYVDEWLGRETESPAFFGGREDEPKIEPEDDREEESATRPRDEPLVKP